VGEPQTLCPILFAAWVLRRGAHRRLFEPGCVRHLMEIGRADAEQRGDEVAALLAA
jgi:hypothetical protein